MSNDTQSRKWQLTINNPVEKGFTHDFLKEVLADMKSVVYYCMADEIGEEGTYHTHLYIHSKGGIRFSTLKKKFDGAHFEMAKGTAQQNMEYVSKTGKWKDNKKSETCVPDTFEEYGEMPLERQGCRNDIADLYAMIKEGLSDYEILEQMPESLSNLDKLDKVRQILIQETYKNEFRNLDVSYVYGSTGSGKTRSIMERYGYSNVFRVTDYAHPFDAYKGQDVVIFEEFRSGFSISDMLNYLDGYPVELPCRYNNKFACFTKVYIVTNIPLSRQYPMIQREQNATWLAFLRRIHRIVHYKDGTVEYSKIVVSDDGFTTIVDDNPFEVALDGIKSASC
ncbi:replication protein [Lacrimispora indolis]|uniref:replication protein n=1 Tax=Lacrimispora indolis TaxID=69825 RepID=UPI0004034934|nr:replication protein [[Clostridium] methoxybenzovorans]